MSLLIMTLVSVLLVSGMDAVIKTYRKSVNAANAQTLVSTAVTELRNELSFASEVEYKDGKICYRSSDGMLCSISNGTGPAAGNAVAEELFPGLCLTRGGVKKELVSSAASTELVCRIGDVTCSKETSSVTIADLIVYEAGKGADSPLASVESLVIDVQTVKK